MTTPLLLLRAVQLGVHISEMDLLTIGEINDMYTEMQRDEQQGEFCYVGTQVRALQYALAVFDK